MQAARRLESAIGSAPSGSPELAGALDEDLLARVRVAESLAALDLVRESRVRESLRERLRQAMEERRALAAEPPVRRPWALRRPVLAAEIALLAVVVLLAVVAPRSLAALVEPVARIIERVRVGDNTQILRHAPQTGAEVAATLAEHLSRLANGESWHVSTPYGGFGGGVPRGQTATVRHVKTLADLRSLNPTRLQAPTTLHRGEPVRFDHAFAAPGGIVLVFFGSGATELLLTACPVGEGRSVAYSRVVNRTTPEGEFVLESPEMKSEEMSFGGQTVVWDPDPEPPPASPDIFSPGSWSPLGRRSATSALRWEEDGVSYSLMGRALTREEAVDLFLSRRRLDEVQ
jgi:hypothetical protein